MYDNYYDCLILAPCELPSWQKETSSLEINLFYLFSLPRSLQNYHVSLEWKLYLSWGCYNKIQGYNLIWTVVKKIMLMKNMDKVHDANQYQKVMTLF